MPNSTVLSHLQRWAEQGVLRSLDLGFSQFIAEHSSSPSNDAMLLAAALVSERNGHGHVCLDLAACLANPKSMLGSSGSLIEATAKQELAELLSSYSVASWQQALAEHSAVDAEQRPTGNTPFVLAGCSKQPLFYLRRYWHYEQRIQNAIQQRLANPPMVNKAALSKLLQQLFAQSTQQPDWQKIACFSAAQHRFAIITGGPGTGKTTTVVRLLALLQGLREQERLPPMRIHLAAPTGKAAARLSESISGSIAELSVDNAIKRQLPAEVSTLHRLLGTQPNSRRFRHHKGNPLHTDCVVVDEASMMDVEIMAELVDALPPNARLILLGDKDQLASVEAGSVLGDLCQQAEQGHYTPAYAKRIHALTGETIASEYINERGSALAQAITMLRHSYRFSAHPGIGKLASLANAGTANAADALACIAEHPNTLHALPLANQPPQALQQLAVAGYRGYLQALAKPPQSSTPEALNQWARQVFHKHSEFQILTAVRRGAFGLEATNTLVSTALQRANLLHEPTSNWYHGRPVMVTQNNYSLRLMNGDVGICMAWPDGSLRVAFPEGKENVRWFLPSRLVGVETVFAMTVHKSQGSEFGHTVLVLPEQANPVLTKELLYTAITRSKHEFSLVYSNDAVLTSTLKRKVSRSSGLMAT